MVTTFMLGLSFLNPIGGLNGLVQTVAILVAIAYYWTPILIALFILAYELILRMDIAGAAGNIINKILARAGTKSQAISILPSNISTAHSHETEQDLFKLDNPLNIFLNVNRAFLYIAFFLSLVTLWPFSGNFTFPSSAYIAIFNFIDWFIMTFEVLLLPTLILVFAPINIYVDVLVDAINLVVK